MATEYKVPKTDAELVDRWFSVRASRLAKEKEVAVLQEEETFLKNTIIDRVPRSKATGVAGRLVRVSIVLKDRFIIADYDKVCDYIVRNRKKGAFALLNKALNRATCKELFEAKKDAVPGVAIEKYKDISYESLKGGAA